MTSPTLNDIGVSFARLTLPLRKRWHLDVRLMAMGTGDLDATQTFKFQNVTYTGTIFRTKDDAGSRSARIVGGKGGLSTVLPAKGYSGNTITLALVLGDLAKECGEAIVVDTDRNLGSAWVRAEQPASRTLDILTDGQWWMAPDGTIHTHQSSRDVSPIASNYMATRWRGAMGLYAIVPDAPGDWTPGRTFSNTSVSGTVSRVELDITAQELTMRVMTSTVAEDRLQGPVEAIVADIEAALLYHLSWPFTVESVDPGPPVTMTLSSNDDRMPNLQRVVLWPGPSGAWATPPQGAAVRVRFVAADPGQPEVYGLDPANAPTTVTIAGGGPAIGRVGDSIALDSGGPGQIQGTVSGGVCTITATQFAAGLPKISTGSAKVTSG